MAKKIRLEILPVAVINAQVDNLDISYNEKIPLYWLTQHGEKRKTGWVLREFKNHGDGEFHKTKKECYAAMFRQLDVRDDKGEKIFK